MAKIDLRMKNDCQLAMDAAADGMKADVDQSMAARVLQSAMDALEYAVDPHGRTAGSATAGIYIYTAILHTVVRLIYWIRL